MTEKSTQRKLDSDGEAVVNVAFKAFQHAFCAIIKHGEF